MAGVSSFAKEVGFVRTIDMQKGFLRPGSLSEAASAVNDGSGKDWDHGLGSKDLKSVGAPLPLALEQKHTRAVWIRTGKLRVSLTTWKRNALTTRAVLVTEPLATMQIWYVKMMWIIAMIIKSNCKKEFTTRKTCWLGSLIARQLWCWVPQRRLDLATLMKCVCKVLIYHPTKTQHFIMIWRCCSRPWMLLGSAPKVKTWTLKNDWFCHLLL